MNEFKIEYEITAADYAEANPMLFKKSPHPFRWEMWLFWVAAGFLAIFPVIYRDAAENRNYLLITLPLAGFLVFYGLQYEFPGWVARRMYRYTNLPNRCFTAEFSAARLKVAATHFEWIMEWEGLHFITESPRLFLFYDGFAMFIFAKRHFAPIKSLRSRNSLWNAGNSRGRVGVELGRQQ